MGVSLLILQNVYKFQVSPSPSDLFVFIFFPRFLVSQLISRFFFLCLAPWQWWFILKFWVAFVLAFPQMPFLRLRQASPPLYTSSWTLCCVNIHSAGRTTGQLDILLSAEVPRCAAFDSFSSNFYMIALTDLSLPGCACPWLWWKHTQLEAADMPRPSSIWLPNTVFWDPYFLSLLSG